MDDAQATAKATRELAETTRARTRTAKARFDAAHRKGMKALKAGDTETFGEAISEEHQAIDALHVLPPSKKGERR